VQIVPGSHAAAAQLILDGEIDIGIVGHAVDDPRLKTRELFEDEIVAIVAPDHPYAHRRVAEAQDFADQTLLLDVSPDDHSIYQTVIAARGVTPRSVQVVPQTGAMVELVKAGLGIGLIARWAVAPLLTSHRLKALALTSSGARNRWHALLLNELADVSYVREFLAITVNVFNQAGKGSPRGRG
jgi:LysR family transcriptional regulator for metE and metH